MGCFDYTCECKGKTCEHVGGQYVASTVVIEVPLNDGSLIYVKGVYEEYGYVIVNNEIKFYLKEFEDFFNGWLEDESDEDRKTIFVANKVWTVEDKMEDDYRNTYYAERDCLPYNKSVVELTKDVMKKCIRADTGLNIPNDREKAIRRIEDVKKKITSTEQLLEVYKQELRMLKKRLI